MGNDKFIGKWIKPYDDSLKAQVGRNSHNSMKIITEDILQKLKIKKKDIVLDVCCGNGLITKIINENSQEAMSLLEWEAIKYTKEKLDLNKFDFEGSDILSIEFYFRKSGGEINPIFYVKSKSIFLSLLESIRKKAVR